MRIKLILDTSTLFNLGHRGEMELLATKLREEMYEFWVTPEAKAEIYLPASKAYFEAHIAGLVEERSFTTNTLTAEQIFELTDSIQNAEITAIILAKEHSATVSLDDKTARKKAELVGVTTIGTLGLMRQGLERGWMSDDECIAAVERMRSRGFFIPRPGANDDFSEYLEKVS
jgi:predicted nucleic acid-binding protein